MSVYVLILAGCSSGRQSQNSDQFSAVVYNLTMAALLKRFEPEENVNRWYLVHVQPTLFEPIAVICAWGSWETA
jgi:hypothetical protein